MSETKEVSASVVGYIAKKINKKLNCTECKVHLLEESGSGMNMKYLELLSRGGLKVPDIAFADYVARLFAVLDVIQPVLLRHASEYIRIAAVNILSRYVKDYTISCNNHENKVRKLATRCVVNTFFNNKQKRDADIPREDNLKAFKKRQLTLNP